MARKRDDSMHELRGRIIRLGTLAIASMMAVLALFVAPAYLPGSARSNDLLFTDNFTSGQLNAWEMPFPEDWQILSEGAMRYLHMKRSRPPGVPRRPLQFARLKGVKVGTFVLNVKVRCPNGSMIVVFNYVDTLHFYYVHLSNTPGTQIAVHNGIFIVDGGPRRRIAGLHAEPALPDHRWHGVRIVRDARSGLIKVFMDKETTPRFSAIDRTFTCGQIGLGSFGNTGDFAELRLRSDDSQCAYTASE